MERIIGDMPDNVAQALFDDIHKDFDYEWKGKTMDNVEITIMNAVSFRTETERLPWKPDSFFLVHRIYVTDENGVVTRMRLIGKTGDEIVDENVAVDKIIEQDRHEHNKPTERDSYGI